MSHIQTKGFWVRLWVRNVLFNLVWTQNSYISSLILTYIFNKKNSHFDFDFYLKIFFFCILTLTYIRNNIFFPLWFWVIFWIIYFDILVWRISYSKSIPGHSDGCIYYFHAFASATRNCNFFCFLRLLLDKELNCQQSQRICK